MGKTTWKNNPTSTKLTLFCATSSYSMVNCLGSTNSVPRWISLSNNYVSIQGKATPVTHFQKIRQTTVETLRKKQTIEQKCCHPQQSTATSTAHHSFLLSNLVLFMTNHHGVCSTDLWLDTSKKCLKPFYTSPRPILG